MKIIGSKQNSRLEEKNEILQNYEENKIKGTQDMKRTKLWS